MVSVIRLNREACRSFTESADFSFIKTQFSHVFPEMYENKAGDPWHWIGWVSEKSVLEAEAARILGALTSVPGQSETNVGCSATSAVHLFVDKFPQMADIRRLYVNSMIMSGQVAISQRGLHNVFSRFTGKDIGDVEIFLKPQSRNYRARASPLPCRSRW